MRRPGRADAFALIAACALHIALAFRVEAQADPAAVVRAFFDRHEASDLRGAASLWVPGAAADEFVRRHRVRVEKRCVRIDALTIDAVSADPPAFDVAATMTFRAATPGSTEWRESSRSRVTLQRHEWQWRIAAWTPRELELVDGLARATTDDERAALLDASEELQTTTFVRLASQRAIDFVNQGRHDDARKLTTTALAVAERLGDPVSISAALSAKSVVLRYTGDLHLSLSLGEEAVAFADAGGNPDVLARALVRLTRTREVTESVVSPQLVERALALSPHLEEVSILAHAALHLGRAHEAQGRYREAFRLADLAYRFAEESGDAAALTSAALFLYATFSWTGDPNLAARYGRRAADVALAAGFQGAAASGLAAYALAYTGGDFSERVRILTDALQKVSDPLSKAILLYARTALFIGAGRLDEAEDDLNQAAALAPNVAATQDIALLWGKLEVRRGDDRAALARSDAARGPTLSFDRSARHMRAYLLFRNGHLDEPRALLEKIIEEGETKLITDGWGSLFRALPDPVRRLLAEVLIAQGDPAAALRVVDQMKDRSLTETRVHQNAAREEEEERRGEPAIEKRIRDLNRRLVDGKLSSEQAAMVRQQLVVARADLLDLRQRLYVRQPAIALSNETGLCIEDLPPHLDELTIVSYLVSERATFAFVLGPKRNGRRELTVRTIEIDADELAARVGRFAALVEQRNLRVSASASEMYDLLLGPIEPALGAARSLCIIPDDVLWRVPFQVLGPDGGSLLVERMPLFYAPSIELLTSAKETKRHTEKPRLLAFANPTVGAMTASVYRAFDPNAPLGAIPETESEVRAIARIYGSDSSRIYVGKTARETTLKREAPEFDVLHIATHGIVYDAAPMFSSLLLSAAPDEEDEDGVLEAREIAALALNADLTVLSACETGRAADVTRGGVIGLSWAFLAAGCPTTVVSQWKAQSAASAALMVEFHRQLARDRSRPEALRQAQLTLRRDRRYRHPFYWAPFIVIGVP